MSKDVKRIRVFHLSELLCPRGLLVADESPMPDHNSELLPVTEHDRIVAELKAEVDHLNRQLADAMSGCCDCPMFKAQGKTVAKLRAENGRLKQLLEKASDFIADCDCEGSFICAQCEILNELERL